MTFAQLALICAVALLGPLLSLQRTLRAPVVIGEMAVGIGLGATGLRVLDSGNATFAFLASAGFALVMFVAGSHVPVRERALRSGLRLGALRATLAGALAVGAGLGVAALFGDGHGAVYAVLIASSSAGVIMPLLAGTPLTAPAIAAMLPQIALADAACIVLLPLVLDPQHVPRALLGIVVLVVLVLLAFAALRHFELSGRRRRLHELSEEHELAIELRTLLALLFGLAAVATLLHVSVMLAGFGLGIAVAGVGEPRRVAKQLFAITEGFFAPIFFVWLGASLDLRELAAHPSAIALGLVLGLAAVLVHSLVALSGQPLAVAALTAAQLGVPVAAVTLGDTLGVWRPGERAAVLLGALVTIAGAAVASRGVIRIATAHDAPGARRTSG